MIEQLKTALADITSRSIYDTSPYGFVYPTKGGDGGDDCLWLGLLTSVYFPGAFDALIGCQSAAGERRQGMFYRNPNRRATDNAGFGAFFSRDMAMGVLVGLASVADAQRKYNAGRAWVKYIDASRPCKVKKPSWLGGGCLIRAPLYKFAPDDRSDISPNMWALMGRVWRFNGWNESTQMLAAKGLDGDYDIAEAKVCPIGSVLHLHAIEGYLKRLVGQSEAYAQEMCDICYSRQPDNLFFKVLAQNEARDEDIERLLYIISKWQGPKDQWIWSRDNQVAKIESGDACGWDLVFLGRLILKIRGKLDV